MAATKSTYSKSAMMESQFVNNAASNNKLFFYALCLTAYESDANVKALFHLDYLSHCIDVDNKNCFYGMVKVGGANAAYHAAARISKVKTRIENNECVILNDAGLNCLADIVSQVVNTDNFQHSQNRIEVALNIISAYYANSTAWGIRYRLNGGDWINIKDYSETLEAKSTTSKSPAFVPQLVNGAWPAVGTTMNVQAYVTNSEGTKYYDIATYELTEEVLTVDAIYYSATDATGVPVTIYMRNSDWDNLDSVLARGDGGVSVVFYNNALMRTTDLATTGYYDVNKYDASGNSKLFHFLSSHGSVDGYYAKSNYVPGGSTSLELLASVSTYDSDFDLEMGENLNCVVGFIVSDYVKNAGNKVDTIITYNVIVLDAEGTGRGSVASGSVTIPANTKTAEVNISNMRQATLLKGSGLKVKVQDAVTSFNGNTGNPGFTTILEGYTPYPETN